MKKEKATKIKVVEENIIYWAKLISTAKPGTRRLDVRIWHIDALIKIRKELMK